MDDNMSNIINNFKNMIQNTESNSQTNVNDNSSNFNITPEMLNNFANILQNNNEPHTQDANNSSAATNSTTRNKEEATSSNIDIGTILKIKSIMETLNKKDDPRSNLLYSLKPYLRESKKKKLDQYVNLFKITQVTNLFKNEKGDGL